LILEMIGTPVGSKGACRDARGDAGAGKTRMAQAALAKVEVTSELKRERKYFANPSLTLQL